MPYPLNDGGSIAIYNTSIGLLEYGVEVNMIAVNASIDRMDINKIPAAFRKRTKLNSVEVNTAIKPIKAFLNLFSSKSYFVQRFYSVEFSHKLVELLRRQTFDIIQLEHLYMCIYLDVIRKYTEAKVVLRTQNVEHRIWEGLLNNMTNPFKKFVIHIAAKRLKKFEVSIISKLDGVIAITPKDADFFKQNTKTIPVIDIPVSFNNELLIAYDFEKQYHNFPVVYHLGSMDWLPNAEGVNWFIKSVMPGLTKLLPDLKIHLAGKKMPLNLIRNLNKNLVVDGTVDNAVKYQEDKAIMIVPLLSGSGIRAKIVEGMSLGKTIISTSVGAQGMALTHEENILIANTPEEFYNQITRCIMSEQMCRRIGNNARQFAQKHFHYKSCAKKMIGFYKQLI